jgi:hypothetical protein
MKIGRRDLTISTPDNLDDQLLETMGHSAKEIRTLLDGWCSPTLLAGAVLPFVKDAPSRQEMAETIAKAGVDVVRADLRGLYDKALSKKSDGKAGA